MIKDTTCTTRVLDTLRAQDDFMTAKQVKVKLNLTSTSVNCALRHLKFHKAVDCMASDGQLWWYTTPTNDDRHKRIEERKVEDKPRRRRFVVRLGGKT